jgi:hypothetical protein
MQQSDFDFFLKFGPFVVGVIALIPALYNLAIGRKGHMRDEYKFAKEFLDDLHENPDMHVFAKEKGLQALANDRYVTPDEVMFILRLPSPVRALRDFVFGRLYLELLQESGKSNIRFRAKYEKVWQRTWRKWMYTVAYVLFAIAAYCPLLLAAPLRTGPVQLTWTLMVTAAIFVPCAWLSLRAAAAIHRAEALVRVQEGLQLPQEVGEKSELRIVSK